jgi:hypothetical protein
MGDFPGSVYRVKYDLQILKEEHPGPNPKWIPVPSSAYTITEPLRNPIFVDWDAPSYGDVRHGVEGFLTITDPSLKRVKVLLRWMRYDDEPKPDREVDSVIVERR